MRLVFVDTSAWYPIAVSSHADHSRLASALRAAVRDGMGIVTTNLVVAETHALLLTRVGRAPALRFVRTVGRPPNRVEFATADVQAAAVERWLERFDDQPFSLTDAISFEVMDRLGIGEALTIDRHFSIAGFTPVPA